jgi:hypothetical protein
VPAVSVDQVFDAEFRARFPSVQRWFETVASQDEFKKHMGAFSYAVAEKRAAGADGAPAEAKGKAKGADKKPAADKADKKSGGDKKKDEKRTHLSHPRTRALSRPRPGC